jgi:hypothetical protein
MPGCSPRSRRPRVTRQGSWPGASFDGQAGSGHFRRPRRLPWAGTRPVPAGAAGSSRGAAGRDGPRRSAPNRFKIQGPTPEDDATVYAADKDREAVGTTLTLLSSLSIIRVKVLFRWTGKCRSRPADVVLCRRFHGLPCQLVRLRPPPYYGAGQLRSPFILVTHGMPQGLISTMTNPNYFSNYGNHHYLGFS